MKYSHCDPPSGKKIYRKVGYIQEVAIDPWYFLTAATRLPESYCNALLSLLTAILVLSTSSERHENVSCDVAE